MRTPITPLCLALICALHSHTFAEVTLPALFGDNMVLQQEAKVPVWGKASPGEKISISFAGQTVRTTANSDGAWHAALRPLRANANGTTLTVRGTNTLAFGNVLVGEVWLCSGQSNMEWTPKRGILNQQAEIATANYPQIRLFTVGQKISAKPVDDVKGSWAECTSATMPLFSAVGYFFGRELHQELKVPVGLICSSWGGTPAQAWTRHEVLEADAGTSGHSGLKAHISRWEKRVAKFPEEKKAFAEKLKKWEDETTAAKALGKTPPQKPWLSDPATSPNCPSCLYGGMIAPLIPFAIRGAIWYQGESNAGNPELALDYRRLLPAMITDWRAQWKQGDFPFLIVQLANFKERATQPGDANWALLRESQFRTLSLPKTALAVAIDIGEAGDIHPKNKQEVGHRLALAGRATAYGRDVIHSGPIFESMRIKDGAITLRFRNATGGLVSKPDGSPKAFAVAGEDRKFVWADARIDGEKIVVTSPEVKKPVAVRYAWADNPEATLYNKAGLPTVPFRTDDWPPAEIRP
ncbi:MAG: hypothetical protein K1X53_14475 [Candidatus Sumerlaeaceae bacterium]|nr:hypothetical protein [Candidatus Sumerlaeaceae bacterium]